MPTPECKAENGRVFYNGHDRTWSVMQGVDDVHASFMQPACIPSGDCLKTS